MSSITDGGTTSPAAWAGSLSALDKRAKGGTGRRSEQEFGLPALPWKCRESSLCFLELPVWVTGDFGTNQTLLWMWTLQLCPNWWKLLFPATSQPRQDVSTQTMVLWCQKSSKRGWAPLQSCPWAGLLQRVTLHVTGTGAAHPMQVILGGKTPKGRGGLRVLCPKAAQRTAGCWFWAHSEPSLATRSSGGGSQCPPEQIKSSAGAFSSATLPPPPPALISSLSFSLLPSPLFPNLLSSCNS